MIVLLVVSYAIRKFKMMPGGMFDFLKSGVVMYAVVMGLLLTIRK
jgi:hypothetical protein